MNNFTAAWTQIVHIKQHVSSLLLLYRRNIRDELKKYDQIFSKHVEQLKHYQEQLSATNSEQQGVSNSVITEEKYPDQKYPFLDKQMYRVTGNSPTPPSVQNITADPIEKSENFRNRLINILKYYKVYVPTSAEESLAPEGMKPQKNDEEKEYDDYDTGETMFPMPSYYANTDTATDSETMKQLVSQGMVQVDQSTDPQPTPLVEESNNGILPPPLVNYTYDVTTTPVHEVTSGSGGSDNNSTSAEERIGEDEVNDCVFDKKLVIMIVLLSLTPLLMCAFCMYFAFCRKNEKASDDEDQAGGGGGGAGGGGGGGCAGGGGTTNNKFNNNASSKNVTTTNEHVKISMLPQK